MPHAHSSSAASSGGDDLGSTDEVKVFKDEGDGEDEKRSSENLLEEKSSLIDWTESEVRIQYHTTTYHFQLTFALTFTFKQLTLIVPFKVTTTDLACH